MTQHRILVTGANGFVGRHLCQHLASQGNYVKACVRPSSNTSALIGIPHLEVVRVPEQSDNSLIPMLSAVDAVVHLAARVHVMRETSRDPLADFRRVNVTSTRCLARAAARVGVRRFVYVSSIKVNGEVTHGRSFSPDDPPGYVDQYGQSKWEAELELEHIASTSGMEWVVVRPPLIYGPHVRGNFLALMKCLQEGFPLPLGSVDNHRSIVSVYNLVDLLELAIYHPGACGNRFLVKDAEDISTADLVRGIARALHTRARLFRIPPSLLLIAGKCLHRYDAIQRLCSSLVVDVTKTTDLLGWRAPMSLESGLGRTCSWFQAAASRGRG